MVTVCHSHHTTVAMVAGMLPIAMSFTGDGSWRAPMGVVVIGGLILSTVLTLVLGLPLAWVVARFDFAGRPLVRALVVVLGWLQDPGIPRALARLLGSAEVRHDVIEAFVEYFASEIEPRYRRKMKTEQSPAPELAGVV